MDEGLLIALVSGAVIFAFMSPLVYALKLFVESIFLDKETEIRPLLIGCGVPILSMPVTFMIPGILDFCMFDFGSGCNEVSGSVFSFFYFLPFMVSLTIIVYSIRIEEKSLKKWAKISAVLTFMYAIAMELLMLVVLQTI